MTGRARLARKGATPAGPPARWRCEEGAFRHQAVPG